MPLLQIQQKAPRRNDGDRRLGCFVAQRFQIPGKAVNRIERGEIVHHLVGQIGDRLRVRDIVALDEIAEQHRIEILLMGLYTQAAFEPGHLREAAPLPEILKPLLHQQPSLS